MRITVVILSSSLLMGGCYQSRAIRLSWEAQPDAGDALNDPDIQEGVGGSEGDFLDEEETCEAFLILRPVSFEGWRWWHEDRRPNCEDLSGPTPGPIPVVVFLFQGDVLVFEEELPCVVDEIIVGPIPPGSYEVAAHSYVGCFFSGLYKLILIFPELTVICNPAFCCPPLAITVAPCETIVEPLVLCCNEDVDPSADCCGY